MGNALRLSVLAVAAGEDLPWCDEDERYDTQPVFDRGQYIGWQTPKVEWLLPPHGTQAVWSAVGPKPGGHAWQVMPSELYVNPVHGMQLME